MQFNEVKEGDKLPPSLNMGKCKLKLYQNDGSIATMTCDEVRENIYAMKRNFREINRTDEVLKKGLPDRPYVEYCKALDDFLFNCKCQPKISLSCEKCPTEDHEGYFCRCESRNINLAKQLRREKHATST